MTATEETPRGVFPVRLIALVPYGLAALWQGIAPSQALMIAWVLELLFPVGTLAWNLAVRHLSLWGTLWFLLPDPFPLWLAPAFTLLLVLAHPWWRERPRVAGVMVAVLLLPAMVDVVLRMDPGNSAASAGVRDFWVARSDRKEYGELVTVTLDPAALDSIALVVPPRFTPWPLTADRKSRMRAGGLLLCAAVLALFLGRRRPVGWVLLSLLPVVVAGILLRPGPALDLWIASPEGEWQVLPLRLPLAEMAWEQEGRLSLRRPFAGEAHPAEALSWIERGALQAPQKGGDPAFWPFLRHWAEAAIDPRQPSTAGLQDFSVVRRWEIDRQGHLSLRLLP